MNDILRRGWLLALVAGLIILPGCSSDSSETERPAPMEEAEEVPPTVETEEPDVAVEPANPKPSTPQETQDSFARQQEERTLAAQREELLVQTYLTSARRYIANSEFKKAEDAVMQALQARPHDPDAVAVLRQVRALQGHNMDTMAEIDQWVVNKRRLVRQAQVAKANDHFLRANQAFMAGDYESSRKEIEKANLIISFDPHQTDFGDLAQQVPAMKIVVANRLAEARRSEEERVFGEAYANVVEEEKRRELKVDEQVRQSMIRAVESYLQGNFDNAEFLARAALRDRPQMKDARELIDNAQKARHAKWRVSFGQRKKEEYQKWLERVRETQIPYTSLLSWPTRERWDEITKMRARGDTIDQALDDSEAVKRIKRKLANETITLDFGEEEATFEDVVKHIRSTQGFNIVVDSEVMSEKGPDPVGHTLIETNLGSALKTVLTDLELDYVFKDDVLWITSNEKALSLRRPYPRVYEVRDLTVSLPHFKAPDLALRPGPAGETAGRAVWGEDLERTQDTSLDRLVDLLRENVAKTTWDVDGFSLQPSSGQIVAVTTPEIHQQVGKFLNDLRRFTKLTVHVESRFISVHRGFLSDIGFDFRGLGGQNPGTVALLDDVTNGAPYNASAANDNGGPGLPAGASLSPSAGAFYNDGSDGDLRGRTENVFDRVLGSLLSNTGGATVAFQILDDLQIGGLFRAVEKNLDTSLINAPRLTIFNNQRANLTLVNQISYVKDYDVEVAQTAFIADPLIDIIQDGLTLDVKPTVSHDRKYVTLEVQPTIATLLRPIRTFETNLSGLTAPVVFELPEINYSQAATTVKVPDGGYVVIGGLKHVVTVDRRSETPILSNIPLLSFLFTRKGRSDEIRDLIIVIHVKILDLTEEEADMVN